MFVHAQTRRSLGLFSGVHQAPKSHAILQQKPPFPSSNCHSVVSGPTPIPSHFPISSLGTGTGSPASARVAHSHLLPGTTWPASQTSIMAPALPCLLGLALPVNCPSASVLPAFNVMGGTSPRSRASLGPQTQYGGHQPHPAIEHWKWGACVTEERKF